MDPIQIVLVALAAVGVWAVVELALVLRRTRSTMGSIDKTVDELSEIMAKKTRPVIAKLDGAVDELAPALAQVEPLLKQAGVAMEALSADLVEVNGVLRDVAQVTGTVSTASGAVTGIADAASEKVQRLLGKKLSHRPVVAEDPATLPVRDDAPADDPIAADEPSEAKRYFASFGFLGGFR